MTRTLGAAEGAARARVDTIRNIRGLHEDLCKARRMTCRNIGFAYASDSRGATVQHWFGHVSDAELRILRDLMVEFLERRLVLECQRAGVTVPNGEEEVQS